MEIQLGFQPRVLHPQETSIQTTESEGERLGPNCRHKDLVQQTQPRYLLPTGEDRVFQGIARVVSIGSDWAEFCLWAFSTLGKLVPAAESAWKLFLLLLDQVW